MAALLTDAAERRDRCPTPRPTRPVEILRVFSVSRGRFNSSAGTGRWRIPGGRECIKGRCEETVEPSPLPASSRPWEEESLVLLGLKPSLLDQSGDVWRVRNSGWKLNV